MILTIEIFRGLLFVLYVALTIGGIVLLLKAPAKKPALRHLGLALFIFGFVGFAIALIGPWESFPQGNPRESFGLILGVVMLLFFAAIFYFR